MTLGENCGVWYHATIRADRATITIGDNSNIQDNCVVHVDPGAAVQIGHGVTVGHGALITQNTRIPDNSLVLGNPGKVKRKVTPEEIEANCRNAMHYAEEVKFTLKVSQCNGQSGTY